MFVSDKVIYLQLQKSGCNSVARIIKEIAGGEQLLVHALLNDYNTGKKIAGTVRNPWDWYVSLWSYGCAGRGTLHDNLVNQRSKFSFKSFRNMVFPFYERMAKNQAFWKKVYSDSSDTSGFKNWLIAIHKTSNQRWLREHGLLGHPAAEFTGLLTFRFCKFYYKNFLNESHSRIFTDYHKLFEYFDNDFILDYVIHTEHLEKDTLMMLEDMGYDISASDSKDGKVLINKSEHKSPSDYYDDETYQLVREKDALIIDKFGYDGPSSS